MKKIKIWYWIVTLLFAAFMLSSAIQHLLVTPDSVKIISEGLGYPKYIIPFLGITKLLGVIAILIPGLNRIKEWAYAGLFFDLAAATYSILAFPFQPPALVMILPISFLFISYFLWHRLKRGQ